MGIGYYIGEIAAITLMAVALGLDAFSVSLGIGAMGIRLKHIFYIGLLTGGFHVIMPFIGMGIGRLLSQEFGGWTPVISGAILILIGAHMFFHTFTEKEKKVNPFGMGMFLFAFGVSVDSLTIGLSLGMFGTRAFATVVIFGTVSTILTWLGCLVGRRANHLLGVYGEMLGGVILFGFGLHLLWS